MPAPKAGACKIDVRILVVGDAGVGKTSLIMALIEDAFCASVPARVDRVLIPTDVCPERALTAIYDYTSREQSEKDLIEELHQSNVICLVYSVQDEASVERIQSYWLKLIHDNLGSDHGRPIILVGNKSDNGSSSEHIYKVLPIMNNYMEIETCVESSAKTMKNISEVFYYAQKAVVYPIKPLYNAEDKELTTKCRRALIHIFKLSDLDNDGMLSDEELNVFQTKCFDVPLTDVALEEVKKTIAVGTTKGVIDGCITLEGFLYLHQLFIHRGRHETTWAILKRFGYNVKLQMRENYLYPPLRIPPGCSVEFSQEGVDFLNKLFRKYDEDRDGCLSHSELASMFSVCPSMPWTAEHLNSVETTSVGWVTYRGFMNLWIMNAFLNVTQTMELLAYLGFNLDYRSQLLAFRVTRDRRIDIEEKETDRKVFQCHVIGSKDAGKTVFCRSFVGKNLIETNSMDPKEMTPYVINDIEVKGKRKHLLMQEVDLFSDDDKLTKYEVAADVVCMLYDGTRNYSFGHCAQIYLKYFHKTKVPVLFVATKVDANSEIEQQFELSPSEFCKVYNLPMPVRFTNSDIGRSTCAVYGLLGTMAVYPHLKNLYPYVDNRLVTFSRVTFGASMAVLAGFLLYRNIYV